MIRRIAATLTMLLGITLVTFVLIEASPGDPALVRSGLKGIAADNRALLGLDRPLPKRYLEWLTHSARLDFGRSLTDGRWVRSRIAEALPTTALLAFAALFVGFASALVLGVWSALHRHTRRATLLDGALALLYGTPAMATALLLLRLGAPYGSVGFAPVVCLALPSLVTLTRHQHTALVEVLGADYLRTARAKGASEWTVLIRHALRNALFPTVTVVSNQLPVLLSGSILIEQVFGLHGMGQLAFDALAARDYPLLMGIASVSAVITLLAVQATELCYALIDPRLRKAAP